MMRYHFEKPRKYTSMYGETYRCDHPVYSQCTLYKIGRAGLAVIQQRYDPVTKKTWWTEIDPWLTDVLYLHPGFKEFFDSKSGVRRFISDCNYSSNNVGIKNETYT